MDVEKFVLELQEKYNYSEELVELLKKAIPALIVYFGEDKIELIKLTLQENEIHIQRQGENTSEYLNEYFGTQQNWQIPTIAGAFQHTQLSVKDGIVNSKSIIYVNTITAHKYTPFSLDDDSKVSNVIHEICHAIKGYGKIRVENNKVIVSSGLSDDYYSYDSATNTFSNISSTNVGFEEALNSYDEASVMTIMTGVKHEVGAYPGLTSAATRLLKHEGLAKAIKTSQFSGGNEWKEYLGEEDSKFLSENFDEWISAFYNYKKKDQAFAARDRLVPFILNYTDPLEYKQFEEAKSKADQVTMNAIEQIIRYNHEKDTFEPEVAKSL